MGKSEYFLGLDLGQSKDYTALALVERIPPQQVLAYGRRVTAKEQREPHTYHCNWIERLPLGTSYPAVVTYVAELLDRPEVKGNITLALDYTGVGRPVFDSFVNAHLSGPVYGITITGGDSVIRDGRHIRAPKRDLISSAQVLLQGDLLRIAPELPDTPTLVRELLNYRVKIDPVTAHDSYSAWREGVHDDLVLALAMAVWFPEHRPTPPVIVRYRA